jgi:hypothetical protein
MPATPRTSYNSPLSGDVTQAFNPMSWLNHSMGQFGFINITQAASSNRGMEAEIVQKAASYGRQLGRMTEVLEVLIEHLPKSERKPAEKKAIEEFNEMVAAIAAVKAGHSIATPENVDRLISGIRDLKTRDQKAYDEITGRLRRELLSSDSPKLLTNGIKR